MSKLSSTSITLSGLKNLFAKFFKNLSWLFFVFFLLLLVLEIFEIKTSVGIVLNISQAPAGTSNEKGDRINFDSYNQVVNRIEAAPNFQPSGGITKNPFTESVPAPTPLASPTPSPSATTTHNLKTPRFRGVFK